MKRILPRFFRCFLIAALAAAIAVPFAPAAAVSETDAKLTVSPSSAVPGQWITLVGSGFNGNARVNVQLSGNGATVVVVGSGVAAAPPVRVSTTGTFTLSMRVPFHDTATAAAGTKTWTATETTEGGRTASSSGFTIQERQIYLSPSPARPGATVEVFGSGWGVKTRGSVSSQVTLTLSTNPNAKYGPFPVESNGEFTGSIVVPADMDMPRLTVIATDNNGPMIAGGTGGFSANQTVGAELQVATGVVTLTPSTATTDQMIVVSGAGFPARTELSEFQFGYWDLLPSPPPVTDAAGSFTIPLTVPPCYSGASGCGPWGDVVHVSVADVIGLAVFTYAEPSITLSTGSAQPGETITITGTAFSAYANVDAINIGQAPALPEPAPRTDALGDFSVAVVVPALNPGAYTITVRTIPAFTATAPIAILGASVSYAAPPEVVFSELTSRGLLTLAAAAPPGGTSFGAYVPGLPGDTLMGVEPYGVLVLTLTRDARISVSGQPAVDVAADTPTFFALGAVESVKVVEVTVTPSEGSVGSTITISGTGFPARTPLSALDFGGRNLLPAPAPVTDASGRFAVPLTVFPPHCPAGALCPSAVVVNVRVGDVVGHAPFYWRWPFISLSTDTARPGDKITITGTGFSAFANVDTINFGVAPALPTPNPLTDGAGDFTADVTVPALNPGAYTITVRTGPGFTATAPFRIWSAT